MNRRDLIKRIGGLFAAALAPLGIGESGFVPTDEATRQPVGLKFSYCGRLADDLKSHDYCAVVALREGNGPTCEIPISNHHRLSGSRGKKCALCWFHERRRYELILVADERLL